MFSLQIYFYTSLLEIFLYGALFVLLASCFLKYFHLIRSPYVLPFIVLVASIVLGLVPYKIRIHDWALFFLESAKDETVTYYVDPYMNFVAIVWDAIFPVAHLVLMSAIAGTYWRKRRLKEK